MIAELRLQMMVPDGFLPKDLPRQVPETNRK
jgi:hypothetical protein